MPSQTRPTDPPDGRPAGHPDNALRERPGHTPGAAGEEQCVQDVRPFAVRLDELRRAQRLTFRALEARLQACAKPGERPMTNSHLAGLTTGRLRPTPRVVELTARVFGLAPQSFIEWRLWQVQELFDPERTDGLEAAVGQLFAFFDDMPPDVHELDTTRALASRRDVFALRRVT